MTFVGVRTALCNLSNFFPGGILILEAQGYSSYHKKRKLTPKIFENFQSIQLMPDQFPDFLLNEVGFTTFHTVAVPKDASKGFQRPIQVRYRFSFFTSGIKPFRKFSAVDFPLNLLSKVLDKVHLLS